MLAADGSRFGKKLRGEKLETRKIIINGDESLSFNVDFVSLYI